MRYRGDTLLDSVKRMGVTEKGKRGTNEEKNMEFETGFLFAAVKLHVPWFVLILFLCVQNKR